MGLRLLAIFALVALSASQKSDSKVETKQNDPATPIVLLATRLNESENQKDGAIPSEIGQFYARQQYTPELYGLTYLQPQYQGGAALPRLQPQIVLYGPGGQGQPILINPGNPPGNFLIPQGPGPNVIIRNNDNPQGFPIAGYPKPAHIPPIEKDAEEIPTNPAKIPPLQSDAKSATKPRSKPEKLETFTEINQTEENTKANPESVSLRPGERFFILNGDHIYNYPFEAQPQIQGDIAGLRYTNAQPFPQNPPKFVQPFAQELPQILQKSGEQASQLPISVPNLLLRNSFVSSQQQPIAQQPPKTQSDVQTSSKENENNVAFRTTQQYFRTGLQPIQTFFQNPQEFQQQQFLHDQQSPIVGQQPIEQQFQGIQDVPKEVVQPQFVGQFRFTPEAAPQFYQFRDDLDNEAIVVDASFDAPNNYDGRADFKDEGVTNTSSPRPVDKASEPSMAQAGPQATAIAGPGGVAGSAPRGTAIVGKGGLAVSSPQATAVAGTKEDDKRTKPTKKE